MKFIIFLLAWWELYRNTGSWWNPQDSSLHIILSETYLLHQKAIFVVTAIKYFKHSLVTVIFDLWANMKVNALNDNRLSVDTPYSPWAFHTTRCKLWMLRWFNRYCFIQVYITTTIWKLQKKWKNIKKYVVSKWTFKREIIWVQNFMPGAHWCNVPLFEILHVQEPASTVFTHT